MSATNPYAPPKAGNLAAPSAHEVAWQDGRWVVWDGDSGFPQRCLVCGADHIVSARTKLVWRPSLWRWGGLLLGLFWLFIAPAFIITWLDEVGRVLWLSGFAIFLLIHFLIRTVVPIHTGWCETHRRYRRVAQVTNVLLGLGLIAIIAPYPKAALGGLMIYVLTIAGLQLTPWQWLLWPIRIGRHRDRKYWIAGCGAGFRDQLPDFNG